MIKAAIFDLDETLFDRGGSLMDFLADQYGRFESYLGNVSLERWREEFVVLDSRHQVHVSTVYPSILRQFGGDVDKAGDLVKDYYERCCTHARAFPFMEEALADLRSRGLTLGLITNGETVFQTRHINALDLDKRMDTILISEAEGARKPEAEIFKRAAFRLGVEPHECIFMGDNPIADILGAHSAGMYTAWFSRGYTWPVGAPPRPGALIDDLTDVAALIDIVNEH